MGFEKNGSIPLLVYSISNLQAFDNYPTVVIRNSNPWRLKEELLRKCVCIPQKTICLTQCYGLREGQSGKAGGVVAL
jgi:hypothetical protein